MSIFRASDGDGQVLHGATVQELAERTPSLGTAATLWDIREMDPDGQREPKLVGYMVGGVLREPDLWMRAGLDERAALEQGPPSRPIGHVIRREGEREAG